GTRGNSEGSMASRLLHRLRHALAPGGEAEGPAGGCAGPEDCPESSELEDDTEGLATRLSGTLSFSSNEEEEEEEEEGERGARLGGAGGNLDLLGPPPHRGSHLLTRQLQELWRKSRGSFVPQRLLFEVTSASVVSERNSKHVVRGFWDAESPQLLPRKWGDDNGRAGVTRASAGPIS
uniref:Sorting nexin family member 21 n=1 Tax=Pseudonaja textilis TaxID=8673 RepID=A0A670ZSM5_PSETE